jgi:hypothetical protein
VIKDQLIGNVVLFETVCGRVNLEEWKYGHFIVLDIMTSMPDCIEISFEYWRRVGRTYDDGSHYLFRKRFRGKLLCKGIISQKTRGHSDKTYFIVTQSLYRHLAIVKFSSPEVAQGCIKCRSVSFASVQFVED